MEPQEIGSRAKALDPLHALCYFAPEVADALTEAGLEAGGMGYFAGRSAPMGAVGPEVVAATFYNFNPELVAQSIPRAWDLCAPDKVTEARYRGVDAALRRILGDSHIRSVELAEAAELASIAARAAQPEGRALFAAHAGLAWPEQPHMVLWHALTLLREHRGDGHVAALLAVGLSGIEALITHTATGAGFTVEFARTRRAWSRQQWAETVAQLCDRGLLSDENTLTELGQEVRRAAEDLTDDLGAQPWQELGDDGVERLAELTAPLRKTVGESGVFPARAFGPRWGGLPKNM